jgi:hypothetical protein
MLLVERKEIIFLCGGREKMKGGVGGLGGGGEAGGGGNSQK